MDYEGPTHMYVCPYCEGPLLDESTASHADNVNRLVTGVDFRDQVDYVSLRCARHPECNFWETSAIELKALADRRYSLYYGLEPVYEYLPDYREQ